MPFIRFQRMCRKCGEVGGDNKLCSSINFACKFSCILFYDVIVFIVYVAWLGEKAYISSVSGFQFSDG